MQDEVRTRRVEAYGSKAGRCEVAPAFFFGRVGLLVTQSGAGTPERNGSTIPRGFATESYFGATPHASLLYFSSIYSMQRRPASSGTRASGRVRG